MKSLKFKLFSSLSMFTIALAMLIIGVWAVGETQTITMQGSVNFEIADKSLYVKDVRMQEDVNSAPYSLKEQGRFMPGFINGNFDMNLGDFTNSYGSFALYFDIINTMDETTNETFAYTVEQPTAPSGTTVSVSILNTDGTTLEQIPQGTVKPSEISDSTLVTATIKLTIASTSSSSVDLSGITITINQVVPEVYDYFTFDINEDNQTVTLTDYDSSLSDSTDVVIPSTVSQNSSGEWIEGTTYTVTAIASAPYSNGVFYNSGITSIELPSTLQSIGRSAFRSCSGLTSVDLSGCTSLTSIGSNAFSGCDGLTGELNLGGCTSLTSIGEGAFFDCSGLTGELDFSNCTSLTSIGSSAFQYCSGLTGISLPSSLTSIGESAFQSCSGLTSVDLSGCTNLTSIERSAFRSCSGLTSVTFPSSLTSIGSYAFEDCSGLTSISLPSSLTSIGYAAFYGCDGLTGELNLGECTSLTSIGDYAFRGCSGLTGGLNLGGCTSLTSIGSDAFYGCRGLTGELNLGECTSLTSIGDAAFYYCRGLTSISLPSSLTSIGEDAFSSCSGLTSVDLSGCTNLTSIERSAFSYCSGLTSISLPSSLTSIGDRVFSFCSGLTSVDLSGCTSLTSIGDRVFYYCSGLTSISLPSSLTSIGSNAFQNCSSLTSVTFENTTGWKVSTSSSMSNPISVDVTNASTNASNLTGQYYNYYWKRNV